MKETSLKNKSVIITSATGNIGRATTKSFVKQGARILLVGDDEMKLRSFRESFDEEDIYYFSTSLYSLNGTKSYINKAKEIFNEVDICFLNVEDEISTISLTDLEEDEFEQHFLNSLKSVWLGLKYNIEEMKKRNKGNIIVSYSIHNQLNKISPLHVTGKFSVFSMVKSVAEQLLESGIRINTLFPEPVDSELKPILLNSVYTGFPDEYSENLMVEEPGNPNEIAKVALLLASEESKHITGAVYPIDMDHKVPTL
ncbi:MAG: SDR family oxidoreductase [bacterium]